IRLCCSFCSGRTVNVSTTHGPRNVGTVVARISILDRSDGWLLRRRGCCGMSTIENESGTGKLTGKRAVVTGGTRGIGAAIVRQLLDSGADVLTTARSTASTPPEGAGFVTVDVRTPEGVEALATSAREELGGVDILV